VEQSAGRTSTAEHHFTTFATTTEIFSVRIPTFCLTCAGYKDTCLLGKTTARVQVRLYRNGDAHFAGMSYPVSSEHHRTLDSLLEDLTHSATLCDRTVLPQGVRFLFALDNGRRITTLDQLEDGASYVCSSRPLYRRLQYARIGGVVHPSPSRSHLLTHHQVRLHHHHHQFIWINPNTNAKRPCRRLQASQ